MPIFDLLAVLTWWAYIFLIGVSFLPLGHHFFSEFKDKGYIFSKTIGIAVISYIVFILSYFKLLVFDRASVLGILAFMGILLWAIFIKSGKLKRLRSDKNLVKLFVLEEGIFLILLTAWAFIRSFQPDIFGIEKFMNFGFINSILRTENFPPLDPWFSNESINYYYFGHLVSAVLIKLTTIPSNISFNIMQAFIFSLIFTSSFSFFITLFSFFSKPFNTLRQRLKIKFLLSALISSAIVSLSGNLQAIYSFFSKSEESVPFWQLKLSAETFPNSYWYPSATRFVENAIHEFPAYATVLSDLHAHLLNTPFTILVLAFIFTLFLKNKQNERLGAEDILFLSFLLSILFMVNSWDFAVFYGLAILTISILIGKRHLLQKSFFEILKYSTFFLIPSLLLSLPFLSSFKPFVAGIGINCSPDFLTSLGKFGPFLFEKNYCQLTPFWQLILIYGFFIFFATSFLFFIRSIRMRNSDFFILILFAWGLILIAIPEIIYLKDIYPEHFRANTMFKLSYTSFVILSIASSYALFRILGKITAERQIKEYTVSKISFVLASVILLFIVFLYPVLAINSYYNNFQSFKGLDGTKYLATKYRYDYEAISWINQNLKNQEIILEAPGESYTDYGRVSSYTGNPTIINWTAHEWLWRGSADEALKRTSHAKSIYESSDLNLTKTLIKNYDISYIYLGELEKQKYKRINPSKFDNLGEVVYSNKKVKVYKINL